MYIRWWQDGQTNSTLYFTPENKGKVETTLFNMVNSTTRDERCWTKMLYPSIWRLKSFWNASLPYLFWSFVDDVNYEIKHSLWTANQAVNYQEKLACQFMYNFFIPKRQNETKTKSQCGLCYQLGEKNIIDRDSRK